MKNVQSPEPRLRRTPSQTSQKHVQSNAQQASLGSFAIGILVVIVVYQGYILFTTRNMTHSIAAQTAINDQSLGEIENALNQALSANQKQQEQQQQQQ